MELILLIPSLCFITSFIHILTRPLIAFLSRPSREENDLQKEVKQLRKELLKTSMRDDYISYVKLERKIVSYETKIQELSSLNSTKNLLIKYAISYGLQAIFSFSIVIISLTYRYTPVMVFNKQFNFTPFSSLMKFPTGIEGAISVPFWVFVNSFVSRTIVGYLKN